jgi:hypothetical protein
VAAQTSSKAISARLIVVATDEDLPKFAIQGRTVTVTEETIVVKTKRGERAITVRPQTRLWSDAGRLTSLHDVHPGEQIIALGQPTEIGQWIAGLVVLPGAEPLANLGLRGQVVERDAAAGTLLVKTKERGQITVITNEETSYRIPGIELPALEDIQVGDQIVAIGRFQSSDPTTFMARGIGVIDSSTREDES